MFNYLTRCSTHTMFLRSPHGIVYGNRLLPVSRFTSYDTAPLDLCSSAGINTRGGEKPGERERAGEESLLSLCFLLASIMAGNDWINSYLEAILDAGPSIDAAKASLLLRERGRFSPTRYFVEEVITGFDETDLYKTWVRVMFWSSLLLLVPRLR